MALSLAKSCARSIHVPETFQLQLFVFSDGSKCKEGYDVKAKTAPSLRSSEDLSLVDSCARSFLKWTIV